MTITRSVTNKQNHNAKRSEIAPWSDLIHDALFIIMMKLGVGDFLSFSWVCSSWRSFAHSNRAKFLKCQQPMLVSFMISPAKNKKFYIQYSEGRKFKTMLPNCIRRICYGVTSGYLILYRAKTNDFWLVNPITRHELHFLDVPRFRYLMDPIFVSAILVYSRSLSAWVFLFSFKSWFSIWFSIAGKQTGWKTLCSDLPIQELYAFKGKIYTRHDRNILSEMTLNPEPTLTTLKMKNVPRWDLICPNFVSSDEKLYVLGCKRGNLYEAFELDFDNMEWVPAAKTLSEYAIFISEYMCGGTAIKLGTWVDPGTQYERCVYIDKNNRLTGRCFTAKLWYFPHDSLNDNLGDDSV